MDQQYRNGYYAACDDIMNFINTLDEKDVKVLRKRIFDFAIRTRPKEYLCNKCKANTQKLLNPTVAVATGNL